MKNIAGLILTLFLLASCASEPEIVDNGNPGRIRVVVFLDENRNGVMDQGETGLVDQVAIGQDISCPVANNEFNRAETDASGEALYEDLGPGKYCVMYMGQRGMTTDITVEVYLSSDREERVAFGLTGE